MQSNFTWPVLRNRVTWLALVALIGAAVFQPLTAQSQTPIVWQRGYPELGPTGCVEYVASWSDGTFTSVPWDCPSDAVVKRPGSDATASRGYPQVAGNGCTEYVAAWSDGTFTWVPVSCPNGITYYKPGTAPIGPPPAPSIQAPASTPTPNSPNANRNPLITDDPPLRSIPLGGTIHITEVNPALGTPVASNYPMNIHFTHQVSGIPAGWVAGWRLYGVVRSKDETRQYAGYLVDGVIEPRTGYVAGNSVANWRNFRSEDTIYKTILLCVTAINPVTNEVRLSEVCDLRTVE